MALNDLTKQQSTPKLLATISFVPTISLYCLEGDWQSAREQIERSLALSPLHHQILGIVAMLEYETGHTAQGESVIRQLFEARRQQINSFSEGRTALIIAAVARTTGNSIRRKDAKAIAEGVLSDPVATPALTLYALAALALLAIQDNDRPAALDLYARLQDQRGTMLWTTISVDRLLGLLSQTTENLDRSASHFEDGLVFCRKAGYRPELAWTCCDYAGALLKRNLGHDQARAMSLLSEASEISAALGMGPLIARVAELRKEQSSPPHANPAGLTVREVEVLRLIAQGKTTREIANKLTLSARTVQRHISNLYAKINVRNRVEATAFAQENPLIAHRTAEEAANEPTAAS